MASADYFVYLLSGLAQLFERREKESVYPYPEQLRSSMNVLALGLLERYPRTLDGLLCLCRQPLHTWWPASLPLPHGFDLSAPLAYGDDLSEEAGDYYNAWLEKADVSKDAPFLAIQSAQHNLALRDILDKLRMLSTDETQRESAQHAYVTLRRFLIEHPYADVSDFTRSFARIPHIPKSTFGDLYDHVSAERWPLWCCDNCGPLDVVNGRLRGAKPGVCDDHLPNLPHIKEVPADHNRRIKRGLHMRTLIPGVPELRLFDWLEEIRTAHDQSLQKVELWPGIDRYDIQLQFSDEVWAVDFKDYKDPYQLGHQLKPLYDKGDLRYQRGYYVFPAYRLGQRTSYAQIALDEAGYLPPQIHLVSDEQFRALVNQKIAHLGKES